MSSGLPKLDMAAVDDDKSRKNRAKKEKKKQKKLDQAEKPTMKERGRTFVRQASASLKRGLTPRGTRSIETQEYAGSESGQEGDQSLPGPLGPRVSMGPSEAGTHQSESTTAPDTPPSYAAMVAQTSAGKDTKEDLRRSLSISSTSSSSSSYDGQEPEVEEPELKASLAQEVEAEVAREEESSRSRAGDTNNKAQLQAAVSQKAPSSSQPPKNPMKARVGASQSSPSTRDTNPKQQPTRSEELPLQSALRRSLDGDQKDGGDSKISVSKRGPSPSLEASLSSTLGAELPVDTAFQGRNRPNAEAKGSLAASVEDSDSESSDTTLSTELSEGGTPEQAAARAKALQAKEPVKWKKVLAAVAVFAAGAAASERIVKACKNHGKNEPLPPPPAPSKRSWGFR